MGTNFISITARGFALEEGERRRSHAFRMGASGEEADRSYTEGFQDSMERLGYRKTYAHQNFITGVVSEPGSIALSCAHRAADESRGWAIRSGKTNAEVDRAGSSAFDDSMRKSNCIPKWRAKELWEL